MKFKTGLVLVVVIILLGIIGPYFVQNPLAVSNFTDMPPSLQHWLGTDNFGRDVFAQLCFGIRNSMLIGIIAGGIGVLLAVIVGGIGPYIGGILDKITSLITNLVIILPIIPLFIILSFLFTNLTLVDVGFILGITAWPWAARSIRSQVLTLKEREFIDLSRMSGQGSADILIREVLPNMLAYIMMVFVILTGTAILAETALTMVGISKTTHVTLGFMLYEAQRTTRVSFFWDVPWFFFPPGIVITLLLTGFFVMHSGLDEVFNPKLRAR